MYFWEKERNVKNLKIKQQLADPLLKTQRKTLSWSVLCLAVFGENMLTEMRNGQQNRLVVWAAGQALFNNTQINVLWLQ